MSDDPEEFTGPRQERWFRENFEPVLMRFRNELGRRPTAEELAEWLRFFMTEERKAAHLRAVADDVIDEVWYEDIAAGRVVEVRPGVFKNVK